MLLLQIFSSLCLGVFLVESWPTDYVPDDQTCVKITVPLCSGHGAKYNRALLPNFVGHRNQAIIRNFTEQQQLKDLLKTKCSKDLVFLLCATLLPICVEELSPPPMFPPCKALCENVYRGCISSMRRLNFRWPGNLNCSVLPTHATGMCVEPNSFVNPTTTKKKPLRIQASCEPHSWIKKPRPRLKPRQLSKYDHIFRARFTRSKNRLAVQKFFVPASKNKNKTYVRVHRCRRRRGVFKNLSNGKVYLVLAKRNNRVLKIFGITEWKSQFNKILAKHATNGARRANRKG